MTDQLKRTPLADEHIGLGARMVDFGGWYMPVQYSGLVDEHTAVRERAGLFDVSHMGEVRVSGPEAEAFLDYITINDVSKIEVGQAQYTAMTTEQGTVIDDLLIYRVGDSEYLLVINASTQDKDYAWISRYAAEFDVSAVNEGPDTAQLALQGPKAEAILQSLVNLDLAEIGYYRFADGLVRHIPALISRTGYTGEDGFECYVAAEDAVDLWTLLLKAGEAEGLLPVGLGARDTLRLEARMNLYGNDMDETTTVLEAGLGWATKLKKRADFIGKTVLAAQKKDGLTRKLIGFEMIDKGIARHDYPVVEDGTEVGRVTSGTHSPTLKKNIGLAYVPSHLAKPGSTIHIRIRNKTAAAQVVKGPFYKRPTS